MNLNPLLGVFVVAVTLSGCESTQNTHKPTITQGSSISTIQSVTEHMERDIRDIRQDATYIQEDAVNADAQLDILYEVVPTEDRPRMDDAIDSVWEMKTHADQIVIAADRVQEETDKLQEVIGQVKKMEDRVAELQNLEKEGRAKAMEKLYGYITLFWIIGFSVMAGGAALAFFVSKKTGLLIIMVGAVMIGFASASQYYLQEIALIGGILLIALIVGGVGMLVWSMVKAQRSSTAIKEIVEMIEILRETMTDDERERIFGPNGVASKVQSDLTKEIIGQIKEKNGFNKLAELRQVAKNAGLTSENSPT
jgi:hypothetical protein